MQGKIRADFKKEIIIYFEFFQIPKVGDCLTEKDNRD
jgi:hypothetical protein